MSTYTKLKAGSLGASLALLLSAAAPAAFAASAPQDGRPPTQPASTQAAPTPDASSQVESDPEMQALENHIADGTLDYQAAKADPAITDATLDDFTAGYIVAGGRLSAPDSAPPEVRDRAADLAPYAEEFASCEGRSGWRAVWPTIFLDSCQANALSATLETGAGVAVLAGLITAETGAGPAVAGAIAAALTVYGGLTGLCNSWGNGIQIIYVPNVPGSLICWSQ